MKIYRFMSVNEFRNFLNGENIEGKFVKGKACFLEEYTPAREKEESVKELTDITSLHFKSTDFEGQMKELSELIAPNFTNGNFDGELKDLEHLTLSDFMKKVRDGATAEVLVEFETTEKFEQEYEKVVMAYKKYLIQEIQANGYSNDTLHCTAYKIDLINEFKDGIGVDTIKEKKFDGVEHALDDLQKAEQSRDLLESAKKLTEEVTRNEEINEQIDIIKNEINQEKEQTNSIDENDDNDNR